MAFVHGKATKVLVNQYDISQYCNNAQVHMDFDTAETSAFGNTYKTYIVGLGAAGVSIQGMYDSTASSGPDAVLNGVNGVDQTNPVSIGFEGLAIGKHVFAIGAVTNQYQITGAIGAVVSFTGMFSTRINAAGGDMAVSLHDLTAETTTVNSTAVDNGALTTNGGYGLLHVTADTMITTATTIKIQHSVDNVTFADLATFTNVAVSTPGSQTVSVAASTTVNRYLRSIISATGTGSITYHVNFARA